MLRPQERSSALIKYFFFGLAVFMILMGLMSLATERVELRLTKPPDPSTRSSSMGPFAPRGEPTAEPIRFDTPEWAPWVLLGGGIVVLMYAIMLPDRLREVIASG